MYHYSVNLNDDALLGPEESITRALRPPLTRGFLTPAKPNFNPENCASCDRELKRLNDCVYSFLLCTQACVHALTMSVKPGMLLLLCINDAKGNTLEGNTLIDWK